jgi:hypothetical protein
MPQKDGRQKEITGFFKRVEAVKEKEPLSNDLSDFQRWFRDFAIRPNVTLFRIPPTNVDPTKFEKSFNSDVDIQLLRQELKLRPCIKQPARKLIPRAYLGHSTASWKLLQFAEDVRPPYFGTKSAPKLFRNYLHRYEELDYEYDSEAEWEDEGEGEELGSEEEPEEEQEDEEDEEEKWVVPHGYLSDDEGNSDS